MAAKNDEFSVKYISLKLGGQRGVRHPYGPTSSHDLVEEMEFLYVEIAEAINNISTTRICNHPLVEITLGNYKSSTKSLPIMGPGMKWNQFFAFDKAKGDVLSVTLKDGTTNTVIGKKHFKVPAEIPSRTPPDARIAPQWESMKDNEFGYHMKLLMSVWFGTQADEIYPEAWFSDAFEVSPSCVKNTRPKLYLAPRLCYVRVTIISGHDLIPTDRKRTPLVYVTATLGQFCLKTGVSSGTNPSWNQDLIFVASESSFKEAVKFRVIDRVDDQHEECIGKLEKKVSEFTHLKLPGSASAFYYDIQTPVKVEPAGDSRLFASKIRMKLATDQAYHVFDECSQYCSDYRAYAKGLWPGLLGKLEVGIIGATGLKGSDEKKQGIDSYVVAKYGEKWAKTRTVVNSVSPKWNEQYSWEVYDMCTVLTLGIYDNRHITLNNQTNDVPIGIVRFPLNCVPWNMLHTLSYPILRLGSSGGKKMGELQVAIRCVYVAEKYAKLKAPFSWMLPKAHYKSPLSVHQIESLRAVAVEVNCMNLEKTDPPLRKEVVLDMLKPKRKSFSIRIFKANYERLYRVVQIMFGWCVWINAAVRSTSEPEPKALALVVSAVFLYRWELILYLVIWLMPFCIGPICIRKIFRVFLVPLYNSRWNKIVVTPPPLTHLDSKLLKLNQLIIDELAEEFDSYPSSETDVNVLRMRYDRLRKIMEKWMVLMGDAASQGERLLSLWTQLVQPVPLGILFVASCVLWYFAYNNSAENYTLALVILCKLFAFALIVIWVELPCFRNDLPTGCMNFLRRLPTNEDLIS